MIGVYNYTVVLTYIGMLISFYGISCAIGGDVFSALICLIGSGVCDMFDGKVASTKKNRTVREKKFGIQIDSLSDVICFGVLPGITVYQVSGGSKITLVIGGLFALCGLIRLAYFNVDEEERQSQTQESRKYYLGMPITSSAIVVPTVLGLSGIFHWDLGLVGTVFLAICAVAFISPIRLKKPAGAAKAMMVLFGIAEIAILIIGLG